MAPVQGACCPRCTRAQGGRRGQRKGSRFGNRAPAACLLPLLLLPLLLLPLPLLLLLWFYLNHVCVCVLLCAPS